MSEPKLSQKSLMLFLNQMLVEARKSDHITDLKCESSMRVVMTAAYRSARDKFTTEEALVIASALLDLA